ncbi:hypothetical protein ACT4UT_13615 [Bacillus sp. B-TM1]
MDEYAGYYVFSVHTQLNKNGGKFMERNSPTSPG